MNFRRTASSLASLHRFYGVDVVAFCEGGISMSAADALVGSMADNVTLDTLFWSTMVRTLKFVGRYHFKSVGNKETLISIARDIEAIGVTTITICLDSDYDHLLDRAVTLGRTAYTHGYSWENDVLSEPVLQRILSILIGSNANMERNLKEVFHRLRFELAPWCEIDISLHAGRRGSIFDREKVLSCADLSANPLRLKHDVFKDRLKLCGYKKKPRCVVAVNDVNAIRLTFGRLVSRIMYHTVIKIASQIDSRIRIDYNLFMKIAISTTFELIGLSEFSDLVAHYVAQRSAFESAGQLVL